MLEWFGQGMLQALVKAGAESTTDPEDDLNLVINLLDAERPRPFRRKGQGTFVVGVVSSTERQEEMLRLTYPYLIRSLSNLLIYLVRPEPDATRPTEVWFVTPERGNYSITYRHEPDEAFFAAVHDRVAPVATARLVIDNIFDHDLEEELHQGDELTWALRAAGRKLDQLNLLP